MSFFLKKYVSSLLMPVPVCLALLTLGVVLLWRKKRPMWTRWSLTIALVSMVMMSAWPVPHWSVRSLERQYPALVNPPASTMTWIVVLGGGVSDDPTLPPNDQLGRASLGRLIEGLRLARAYPEARLLLTGQGASVERSEAVTMRDVAMGLGISPARITVDALSKDTGEQAVKVKSLVGQTPFILVTSATHMPRAMALFRRQGLKPWAAPTDHLFKADRHFDPRDLIPSADNLRLSLTAAHEYLGLIWAHLRGQI